MILAYLAVASVCGVLLGEVFPVPGIVALAGIPAFCIAALVWRAHASTSLFLIFAALSFGISRAPSPHGRPSPRELAFYNGTRVQVVGVVDSEPDIRDTGVNFVVVAEAIVVHGRTTGVSGKLQVHTTRSQQINYGERVTLTDRLSEPRNSPGLHYRDILARRGIRSEMRFPRLRDDGQVSMGWLGWIVPLRRFLEDGIRASLPDPEAALLIAITLGARSASLGDLSHVLIITGLIHIVAISGIKVALVAGIVHETARRAHSRTATLVLSLSTLVIYVLLTGATPAGERSAVMWGLVFIGTYLGRGTVTLVSLSFASAVMVLVDPTLPWDTGYQLSVIGTLAIVAFAPSLIRHSRWLPSPLREALCVTIAAQLGTVPIVAAGFQVTSFIGPVANGLVLPLLPALIVLGMLLGFSAGVDFIAAPLASVAYALLHTVDSLATWLASIPGAARSGDLPVPFVLIYYTIILGAGFTWLYRVKWNPTGEYGRAAREFVVAGSVAALALSATLVEGSPLPHHRLIWLGQGHALLLQDGQHTVLIDGSPRPGSLLQSLGRFLPYRIRAIDLVVVTDPQASNISGIAEVSRRYRVFTVLDVGAEYPSTTYAQWRSVLRSRHIPVYALRTGASAYFGEISLTSLGPDALYPNPRDSVGLLRLAFHGHTILLAGEASARELHEALFRHIELRSDALLVTAAHSLDHAFLLSVHPGTVFSGTMQAGNYRSVKLSSGHPLSVDLERMAP